MKPHKFADLIRAYADGAEIQVLTARGVWVTLVSAPGWHDYNEYRVNPTPEPAAPKWPQTTMTEDDLWSQIDNVRNAPALRAFSNMVIARSCEDGHVIPADKVREIEAKAREEGMKDGSKWGGDRDRMVIRETLKARGISWTSAEVDHIIHRLPK